MAQDNAQRADEGGEYQDSPRKRPVEKFHEGRVHVSIFPNESSKGTFHTASYQVRYTDKNEEWQTGHSYSKRDCENLAKAATKAAEIIAGLDKGREQEQTR